MDEKKKKIDSKAVEKISEKESEKLVEKIFEKTGVNWIKRSRSEKQGKMAEKNGKSFGDKLISFIFSIPIKIPRELVKD